MTLNDRKYKARTTGYAGFYLVVERATGKFLGNLQKMVKGWHFSYFDGHHFKYTDQYWSNGSNAVANGMSLYPENKVTTQRYGINQPWSGTKTLSPPPVPAKPPVVKEKLPAVKPLDAVGILQGVYGKLDIK